MLLSIIMHPLTNRFRYISLFIITIVASFAANAQYKIMGTIYDSSRNFPLESVSVITTSGRGTVTNADGNYQIEVSERDSIWFSYLGKPTVKFPVLKIANPAGFDLALQVNVPILNEVKIRPRNYRQDSLQNRADYSKIFNYKKPGLSTVTPQYGAAVGFDLDEIINIFRFKRNRSMLSFQRRLLAEEKEKFITHRFNKALVRRLSGLTGNELDSFMMVYRPIYEFAIMSGDYEFQEYIKTSSIRFKKGLPPQAWLRPRDEEDQQF